MKKNLLFIIIAIIIIALVGFFFYQAQMDKDSGSNTGGDYSLADIKAKGKIVVGTFKEFAPMTFKDGDTNVGYDMDLIREIAKRIGVEVEIKEMTFPNLFPAVKDKSIDIAISSITITPERSKTMLFSNPYFTSGQVIMLREETEGISKPEDLAERNVGAIRNTTCVDAILPFMKDPDTNLKTYEEFIEELDALKAGDIDAVIHDYAVAAYHAKNDPKIKIVPEPFTQEYYGIMSNIENKTLIDEIDGILRDLKRDGKIKEYNQKWFGQ